MPIPDGVAQSPHLRATRQVGRLAFGDHRSRLFDNRWMHVNRATKAGQQRVAGGRMAFSHEDATPGWGRHSFVVSLVARAWTFRWSRGATVARPTVSREVAGSNPAGSVVHRSLLA